MDHFIAKHADRITGVLSGFDRLVFRGTIRQIAFVDGLKRLLWNRQVLLKTFGTYAQGLTTQLKEASCRRAEQSGRPIEYLYSSRVSKEDLARKIAQRDGVRAAFGRSSQPSALSSQLSLIGDSMR